MQVRNPELTCHRAELEVERGTSEVMLLNVAAPSDAQPRSPTDEHQGSGPHPGAVEPAVHVGQQ